MASGHPNIEALHHNTNAGCHHIRFIFGFRQLPLKIYFNLRSLVTEYSIQLERLHIKMAIFIINIMKSIEKFKYTDREILTLILKKKYQELIQY